MSAIQGDNGYSAAVRLYLQLDGRLVRIAQIGERFLILRDPCEAPPGTQANILIAVDEDEVTHPVELTDGIISGVSFVDFVDLERCLVTTAAGGIGTHTGPVRVQRGTHPNPSRQLPPISPLPGQTHDASAIR